MLTGVGRRVVPLMFLALEILTPTTNFVNKLGLLNQAWSLPPFSQCWKYFFFPMQNSYSTKTTLNGGRQGGINAHKKVAEILQLTLEAF